MKNNYNLMEKVRKLVGWSTGHKECDLLEGAGE